MVELIASSVLVASVARLEVLIGLLSAPACSSPSSPDHFQLLTVRADKSDNTCKEA